MFRRSICRGGSSGHSLVQEITHVDSRGPDHALFREDFFSAVWDLQRSICVPNLKSLGAPVTRLWLAMQNAENWVVWGGQWALGVTGNVTIQRVYDFLFNFKGNYAAILYRFRDIASYLSKIAHFNPPHLHLASPLGVTTVEFRGDLWRQKTRVAGLSCVILCLTVLIEHRLVTDRHRAIAYTALA